MDPVGPWAAYASYGRLSGAPTGATSGAIHTQLTQSTIPPTTTAQVIPSSSFIPSTPIGYENVFNPLLHAGSKPPVHYVPQAVQHRQPLTQTQPATVSSKQSTEGEYQGQTYFEQNGIAWQQSSPFGVLPHESVAPSTTAAKSTIYDNFNTQSLNQLNTQMTASNSKSTAPCVQTTEAAKSSSQPNSTAFYQVPVTYSGSGSTNTTKTYVSSDASNLQQSCIVSSPSNMSSSKDYNVPQLSNHTNFIPSSARPLEKPFTAHSDKQPIAQVQTKAQTKIYPDINNQGDRTRLTQHDENQTQSSPISYCTDTSGGLNYTNNNNVKGAQFQSSNYRHYQQGNNTETEFQHTKTIDYHNSNGSEYGVPTRASPLQRHSQPSPLGHSHSPVYPMYNSPMNSSSPQQSSTNLVAPSSPLDATVSRSNSQSGSVVHQSVITRALNNDKKFPDHYDRTVAQQQPPECWEERQAQQQQQRKYQPHTTISNNYASGDNLDMPSRVGEHCHQRTVNSQNQQPYFGNSPTELPLQDLSSCRGDPISLVKSLPQQQSCQIQQLNNIHKEPRVTGKKRKGKSQQASSETPQITTLADYFAARVPPPAHSSASTQQPNGAYFDFDRWNAPSAASKMFGTPGIHQQPQGIMVNHPQGLRPAPTLPYFAPLHAPPPSEFPQSAEHASGSGNEQPVQQNSSTQLPGQNPHLKVLVPNIEEELDYLSRGLAIRKTMATNRATLPPVVQPPIIVNHYSFCDRTSGGPGFMNTYLRFLKGDRDTSPPNTPKVRKHAWSRSKLVEQTTTQTNGIITAPKPSVPVTRLSQGDPQDDPRYFPLPKERKKNHFDSDDDGFDSDSDFFDKKASLPNKLKKGKYKRGRGARKTVYRKPQKKDFHSKKEKEYNASLVSSNFPRRESSRRAAKEKANIQKMIAQEELDYLDDIDSDSDPAWSPKNGENPMGVIVINKKARKVRNGGKKKPPRNLITAAAQGAGINDLDGYSSDGTEGSSRKSSNFDVVQIQKENLKDFEKVIAAIPPIQPLPPITVPFEEGDFLILKSELNQEWPPLWRVEGKTLLRKFEPFKQDGEVLYKDFPTYTSWAPENAKEFIVAVVNFKDESIPGIIVELLREEILETADLAIREKSIENRTAYQENFEVYIQTLISQALDSNFLTEIFQEQDEYFLNNVKTIDDITNKQKHKLVRLLNWPKPILTAINTWPYFNTINELTIANSSTKACAGCIKSGVSVRVLMFGQSYNFATLDNCPPAPHSDEKDLYMCQACAKHVELLNKVTHLKYRMYIQCAKKVSQHRNADPKKDTTCVLNELLADDDWLVKLFNEVCRLWADVDSVDYRYKINKCGDSINNKTV